MMHGALRHRIKTAAVTLLRDRDVLRERLMRHAAAHGRALVLCYHTVGPVDGPDVGVPTIEPDRFAEHMMVLKEIGDVVPIDWLLQRRTFTSRPTFAVTFDDDDGMHVRHALPVLSRHQMPATFFLSGRSLHDLGSYWWMRIGPSVEAIGLEATCRALGHHATTLKGLIRACRNCTTVPELAVGDTRAPMAARDIRTLAAAGMTIGFHTLRHPPLTRLDDAALTQAVTDGREALAAAAGASVDFFAYPYGDMNLRVANAVRRSGYSAAFALGNHAISPGHHPFRIPRWQPGRVGGADLLGEVALRMARPA